MSIEKTLDSVTVKLDKSELDDLKGRFDLSTADKELNRLLGKAKDELGTSHKLACTKHSKGTATFVQMPAVDRTFANNDAATLLDMMTSQPAAAEVHFVVGGKSMPAKRFVADGGIVEIHIDAPKVKKAAEVAA